MSARRGTWAQLDVEYLTRGQDVLTLRRDVGRMLVAAWWPRLVTVCTAGDLNERTAAIELRDLADQIGDERPDAEIAATLQAFVDREMIEVTDGDLAAGIATIRLTQSAPTPSTVRGQRHRDAVAAAAGHGQDAEVDASGHGQERPVGVQLYVLRASASKRVKIGNAVDPERMAAKETTKQGEPVRVLHTKSSAYAEGKRIQRALKHHHQGGQWYAPAAAYDPAILAAFRGVPSASERVQTPGKRNSETENQQTPDVKQVSDPSAQRLVNDAHERAPAARSSDPLDAGPTLGTDGPRKRGRLAEGVSASVERLLTMLNISEGQDGWRNFYDLAHRGAVEADFNDAIGALREVENISDRRKYAYTIIRNRLRKRGLIEPHLATV